MYFKKSAIVASSLVFVLSTHLFAQEVYTIQNKTLKEALEIISKKSNLSYLASDKLLEVKKTNNIKNVEGLENALEELFKGTRIKAVIKKDAIVIIEETSENNNNIDNSLGEVDIVESAINTTEGTDSYIFNSMKTATKLDLSIKDTPQSITVVTKQNMLDNDINSFDDIAKSVVGLNVETEDSERVWITSRGFKVDYYQTDGVATNHEGEMQQDMIIYDRVEVVKGANGLMSGSGSPAASINLVRKRANSEEFKGNLNLKYGSWDLKRTALDLSFPLVDDGSIRGRFIAAKEDKESFRDNYEKEREVLYTVVNADITDNTTFSVGASYQKDKATAATYGGIVAFYKDSYKKTNFDRSTSFAPKWASMPTTTKTYFADINHIFDNDIELNLSYSHSESYTDAMMALLGYYYTLLPDSNTGIAPYYGWIGEIKNKSSNIDLNTSIPFELFNKEHEIITGISQNKRGYYNSNRSKANSLSANVHNFNPNIPKYIATGEPYVMYHTNSKEEALYLAGKFSLSNDIKLITGVRLTNGEYSKGERKYNAAISYKHNNILTPYLGLVYDFDNNHSLYISYTDIFKPQDEMDQSGNQLDPIEGKNFEIGLKGEYLDKRLISSLTFFRIEQDNLAQVDGNKVRGTTIDSYTAAEGVVSKGIEFELLGKATDNIDINFAFSHFNAVDANGRDVNTIAPRTEAKIATKYKIDDITIAGTVKWKSDIYAQTATLPKLEEGNVVTVDAMLKYDFSKDLSAQLNVKNLFDKKYYINFPYGTQYVYGEPRKITASLNYKF